MGEYRYAFNGKENDKDFGNSQLVQDYGFRIYNPILGRFLSVDPLAKNYPFYTPFQFAGNKPIIAIDLDGLEERISTVLGKDDYGVNLMSTDHGFAPIVRPLIGQQQTFLNAYKPNFFGSVETYLNDPESSAVGKIPVVILYGLVNDPYIYATKTLSDFKIMDGAQNLSGRGADPNEVTDAGVGMVGEVFGLKPLADGGVSLLKRGKEGLLNYLERLEIPQALEKRFVKSITESGSGMSGRKYPGEKFWIDLTNVARRSAMKSLDKLYKGKVATAYDEESETFGAVLHYVGLKDPEGNSGSLLKIINSITEKAKSLGASRIDIRGDLIVDDEVLQPGLMKFNGKNLFGFKVEYTEGGTLSGYKTGYLRMTRDLK